jgi:hypothetical protein
MTTREPLPTIRKYREGSIDLETATLRVALFDDSTAYNFDPINHEFVSDVLDGGTTATELSGTGYSRQDVANAAVTVDGTDTEVEVDADDVSFGNIDGGETIQGWIVYVQRGGDDTTPGDDPIVAVEDEVKNQNGNDLTTNGSPIDLEFSSEGIVIVTSN